MNYSAVRLLARSLTVPYRYACSYGVPDQTWVVEIGTSPFSGQWEITNVTVHVGLPFPGVETDFVEPD